LRWAVVNQLLRVFCFGVALGRGVAGAATVSGEVYDIRSGRAVGGATVRVAGEVATT